MIQRKNEETGCEKEIPSDNETEKKVQGHGLGTILCMLSEFRRGGTSLNILSSLFFQW